MSRNGSYAVSQGERDELASFTQSRVGRKRRELIDVEWTPAQHHACYVSNYVVIVGRAHMDLELSRPCRMRIPRE